MSNSDGGTPPRTHRGSAWAGSYHVILPCLILVAFAAPLVGFQLPDTVDTLTESYEPLKTLKFVHSLGRGFHKWGPMPNFVYGPAYAVPLAYWKLHGDLGKVDLDFPYGFRDPFGQMGTLILIARLAGLAVACACTIFYGRALARLTGSKAAACLALSLCIATSPELIRSFVATRPDGLMLGFLAGAMAAYASILSDGLTRRRGLFLSLMAVASLSCKELTATLFVPTYAAIALRGLAGPPGTRLRFLGDFAWTVAFGVVAYLAINVAYAPSTWRSRMEWWLVGDGKDPEVWAPPGYTWAAYLGDAGRGLLFNLGFGAAAVVLLALAWPVGKAWDRAMLWAPSLGFLAILMKVAGYMPNYFLSPLNVTLALPVAALLASGGPASPAARRPWAVPFRAFVGLACVANLWSANVAWVNAYSSATVAKERYCLGEVDRRAPIHLGNAMPRTPGSSRLAYLGFAVDDRALCDVASDPASIPVLILLESSTREWLSHVKDLPARAAMLKAEGADYGDFAGVEALGYRLDRVLGPAIRARALFDFPVARDVFLQEVPAVDVYRRAAP